MAGRENWCEMAGRKVALHCGKGGGRWAGGDGDGVARTTQLSAYAAAAAACSDIGVGNSGP